MKFILNENKKFKLEERFILVEADEDNLSSNETSQLSWGKLYTQCSESKQSKEALNKFWEGGLPSSGTTNKKDLPTIPEGSEFSEGFLNAFKIKNKKLRDVLQQQLIGADWNLKTPVIEACLAYLAKYSPTIEAYSAIINTIAAKGLSVEDLIKEGVLESNNLIFNTNFLSLTKACVEYLTLQTEIIKKFEKEPNLINIFYNIMSTKGNLDKIDDNPVETNFILASISEIKLRIKTLTLDTEVTDWTATYAAAINKNAVWEDYLYTEWHPILTDAEFKLLLKIQEPFKIECATYGFEADLKNKTSFTNPFAQFIKGIFLKLRSPSAASYTVIHNAISKNRLNVAELQAGGKLKLNSILLCNELYELSTEAMSQYINKYSNLIRNTDSENLLKIFYEKVDNNSQYKPTNNVLNSLSMINQQELALNKKVSSLQDESSSEEGLAKAKELEDLTKLKNLIVSLVIKHDIKTDSLNLPSDVQTLINSTISKPYAEVIDTVNKILTNNQLLNLSIDQAKTLLKELTPKLSVVKKPDSEE